MTETRTSDVAIGVPVHNGARHLPQALDSLLAQRFRNFNVLILDDGSTDGSDDIIRSRAARDSRIQHERQDERRGMIQTWRRVAQLCHERFQSRFFAWYSDHDWVDPNWLGELHAVMEHAPTVALAHARTRLADADGGVTTHDMELLETGGLDRFRRLETAVFSHMGAGDAVYGLFRWSALSACGVFRDELMPDRLLVAEINLHGEIVHVDTSVRYRRRTHVLTDDDDVVARQMHTLFPERLGGKPPRDRLYTSHATRLLRDALEAETGDSELDLARVYLGVLYYQRSLTKFRDALHRERATSTGSHPDPYLELVGTNLDAPVLMTVASHRESNAAWTAKTRDLERARDEAQTTLLALQQSMADLRRTLGEVSAERDAAGTKLAATQRARQALELELAEARQELTRLDDANASLGRTVARRVEELAFLKRRYRWTRVAGAMGLTALKLCERWKAIR